MKEAAARLDRYAEKRDFGRTEEPRAEVHGSASGHAFVVQKHDARRLHYDLRLELDGVLLSWAVPKGPSLSPKERRLAVRTEDHPVDYRDFEGTIPEGEYGGGPVIVWDRGEWRPIGDPHEGLAKGHLDFQLEGERLHGRFTLVRLKDGDRGAQRLRAASEARAGDKTSWLLLKRRDAFATEDPEEANVVARETRSVLSGRTVAEVDAGVPALRGAGTSRRRTATALPPLGEVEPELATLVTAIPEGSGWVFEMKLDGYRALARLDGGEARIATRSGHDWTARFPEIAEALRHLRARSALFDGEIAWVLPDGRTDFQSLQNALGARTSDRSRLVYFVFDLLFRDGVDLRGEPLSVRKAELRTLLAGVGPPLRLCDHVESGGAAFLDAACRLGLEGVMAKRASAPYRSGRGKDWVKVKCHRRQELVVVGSTKPSGRRKGIGALLVAAREGDELRYAGKVGTGFSDAVLRDLEARLGPLETEGNRPPLRAPKVAGATWVRPELVVEVRFTEWTAGGQLRHPAFLGLREDKPAREVIRERAEPPPKRARRIADTDAPRVSGVKVSHPERVLDPEGGITKLELVRYHEAVAEPLLVHAAHRPLMLVRCTEAFGAFGPRTGSARPRAKASCFVQKHAGRGLEDRIGKDVVDGEEVLFATTPLELVLLAQHNVVELHGWGARLPDVSHPDWIVFDLDPDEGLPFTRVVEAALEMRASLDRIGLSSHVKTTGGKGLHVVVPLAARDDASAVRDFAKAVAEAFAQQASDRYVATMSKAKRTGRIFVDWLRNAPGATAVLPYSARARPGAPVAMPVAWKDLPHVAPEDFTVRTVPALLARRRRDPWADVPRSKQHLPRLGA